MTVIRCLTLALGGLLAWPAAADIYAYRDARGVVHITNVPNDPRFARVMATPRYVPPKPRPMPLPVAVPVAASAAASPLLRGRGAFEANRLRYGDAIAGTARVHGLDPALLHAVIHAESAFDPLAVSPAGAMGLMQLMPATAARFGVVNAFDPRANLDGGARYLRVLLDQFGQLPLALAAYNAGENTVIRSGYAIPAIAETQTYVSRVLDFYARYRRQGP